MSAKNIVIIGGGIIGLSIGWQLVKRNFSVTIFDKDSVGKGASWAAAGMLSPLAEVNMQEKDLLQLGLTSSRQRGARQKAGLTNWKQIAK